jgi:hypothetical protein
MVCTSFSYFLWKSFCKSHGPTKPSYEFDRTKETTQDVHTEVVQELAHSVIVFCITRFVEEVLDCPLKQIVFNTMLPILCFWPPDN